ncbi:MAG: hypothetical protein ABJU26_09525 [Flavobacteriaceae bacterium]
MKRLKRNRKLIFKMEKRISAGVPIEKVFLEYGFQYCIDSIKDKGHLELVKILEEELTEIKQSSLPPF